MFGEYNLPLGIVFRYLYVYVYVPGANLSRSGVLLDNSVLFSQKEATFFFFPSMPRRMILRGMDDFHRLPCQNQTTD